MGAKASLGPRRGKPGHRSGPLGLLVGTGQEKEAGGGEALEEDDGWEEGSEQKLSPERGRGLTESTEWQSGVSFTTGDAESARSRKPAFWS